MTDLELAAYLDRGLSIADKARVENHLADCAECRENVTATRHLLDIDRSKRRQRRIGVSALLAAAAVIAFLVVNPQKFSLRPAGEDVMRASDAGRALTAYGPLGELNRAPPRFVWGSAGVGATYRVSLTDETGAQLWSASTADTSAVIPDSVQFNNAAHYYWIADALLTDGSTLSTRLQEFRVAR